MPIDIKLTNMRIRDKNGEFADPQLIGYTSNLNNVANAITSKAGEIISQYPVRADFDNMVATAFNIEKNYIIGDYCRFPNGNDPANVKLYRFIKPHIGEWDLSDVIEVTTGNEFVTLSDNLKQTQLVLDKWFPVLTKNGLNTDTGNNLNNSPKRARTDFISYQPNFYVIPNNGYQIMILYYNNNGYDNTRKPTTWIKTSTLIEECKYFRILIASTDSDYVFEERIFNNFIGLQLLNNIASNIETLEHQINQKQKIQNIIDEPSNKICSLSDITRFSSATYANGTCIIDSAGGGVRTPYYIVENYNSSNLMVRFIIKEHTCPNLQCYILYRVKEEQEDPQQEDVFVSHVIQQPMEGYIDGNEFSFDLDVSALGINYNAYDFCITIISQSGSSQTYANTKIVLENFIIYPLDSFRANSYYDQDLTSMLNKIFTGIDEAKQLANQEKDVILKNPNGDKFKLTINNNNELVLTSTLPKNIVFIGNSILLETNGSLRRDNFYRYGMAATEPTKDYYWIIKSTIESKLASGDTLITKRVFGKSFEALNNLSTLSADFNTVWTQMKKDDDGNDTIFSNNTELVIIQLGDNIGITIKDGVIVENKVPIFKQSIDLLIPAIKTVAPNAKIVWVDSWYNYNKIHDIIVEASRKYNFQEIDIHDLKVEENYANAIDNPTYTYSADGTSSSIKSLPANRGSHPGDAGMAAIANRIMTQLNII